MYTTFSHEFFPALMQYLSFPTGMEDKKATDRYLFELLECDYFFHIPWKALEDARDIADDLDITLLEVCHSASDYVALSDYAHLFSKAHYFILKIKNGVDFTKAFVRSDYEREVEKND